MKVPPMTLIALLAMAGIDPLPLIPKHKIKVCPRQKCQKPFNHSGTYCSKECFERAQKRYLKP